MSKILVLAEKPSVGRELARVLGCKTNGNGCLKGERYIVTWALGHLVTLSQPESYGAQYKTWNLESLPIMPEKMDLEVIPETAKQYAAVKALLRSPEVDSLIIATDAGREGELVARWIIAKAGFRKPISRLWISSQTDKAIRQGFSSLRDGREYLSLYAAAEARAEADWLVGLNVTRALTCKNNAQLSAGRVQTPTLSLIVAREEEIEHFKSREYYHVMADLGKLFATYRTKNNEAAIWEKAQAEEVLSKIEGKNFTVTSLTSTEKRTPVPMLYDLTELQRDANKLYSFSAKQTLNIMQKLYEEHKALTYPRTDSRYLTDDIVPTLAERLRAVSFGSFTPIAGEILREKRPIARACINNAKVSDHHAIIPTEQKINTLRLSPEEMKIYLLVVRRFLTCFYPDFVYRQLKAELSCDGLTFSATGKSVVDKGWKAVYDASEEEDETTEQEQTLPALAKGDIFPCRAAKIKTLRTSPPARYTEATLLTAMENPSKFIEDKKMKEFIGGGLGTPATRADIIEKLFSTFYIEKKGNSIYPTSKGKQLISIVPSDLKEPLLTAKWEKELESISKGAAKREDFLNEIRSYTKKLVQNVITSDAKYVHDNISKTPCPECGKMMLTVNGKKGKMLVCPDRECGHRQNVVMETNARCPVCHKRMELFGDGEKKTYVCACGFREKADTFHQRIGSSGASKQYVQNYLRSQKKQEESGESAFALAMKKAMEDKKK
jgi:DNA topoisomerase-3